jgi:two-component system, chemotaxis family, chemotaxis protein CheY
MLSVKIRLYWVYVYVVKQPELRLKLFTMSPGCHVMEKGMILIVDDCHSDVELTRIALEGMGRKINLYHVTDGKSALEKLRHGGWLPSLVLLDLNMPGMSGIDVLREMRIDPRLKDIPVVAVSSSCLKSDRTDVMTAGANGYVQKSLSLDLFSKDLGSMLNSLLPNFA